MNRLEGNQGGTAPAADNPAFRPRFPEAYEVRASLGRIGLYILVTLLSLLFAAPLVLMLSTALKSPTDVVGFPPHIIPHPFEWHNYRDALTAVPFLLYVRNTVFVVALNVIGVTTSSAFVAYGFSRIVWPGRNALFILVLATMMLPYQVLAIPLYIVFRHLGWINTFYPLVVPAFFGDAFSIFLLRQFFMGIPNDLSDAAEIDGANELYTFARIVLPLTKPALMTVALFQFLYSWNDFFAPLLYLNSQKLYTLSLGLQQYQNSHSTNWPELMAAATVITVPVIALFFFTQRTFIQGITLTGLKG
ncbi:MAG TPA: carbohydrate ABC transporter permease [Spirochaetia bacterium]|nr:carbohydrate ABC transporter permease [Spirochaetia bacterium]